MDVYVVGAASTPFGRFPDQTHKALTRQVVEAVFDDADPALASAVGSCWFGNCGMWVDGQGSIRGQICLNPLVEEGLLPETVPITNVESGCATASLAFLGAVKDVASGLHDCSLAIGVEKTYYPDDPEKTSRIFAGGIDQYDPQQWQAYYRDAGEQAGKRFDPGPGRTVFMDTYAMQACYHMQRFGTSQRQIAAAAAKNHNHGALNPLAQYRMEMTVEEVLADRPVTHPLTRAMCAPIGDGASGALLVSGAKLRTLPASLQERAIRVSGIGESSGRYRALDEHGLSRFAAQKAYAMADLEPTDVDVVELHDATSFCEIFQLEMLGFCEPGSAASFIEAGEASLGGSLPVNTSGGLVSKGHPVGATGLSMLYELVHQLRGEAGDRQVQGATVGLAENGGGVMGFDEAACTVILLSRR